MLPLAVISLGWPEYQCPTIKIWADSLLSLATRLEKDGAQGQQLARALLHLPPLPAAHRHPQLCAEGGQQLLPAVLREAVCSTVHPLQEGKATGSWALCSLLPYEAHHITEIHVTDSKCHWWGTRCGGEVTNKISTSAKDAFESALNHDFDSRRPAGSIGATSSTRHERAAAEGIFNAEIVCGAARFALIGRLKVLKGRWGEHRGVM